MQTTDMSLHSIFHTLWTEKGFSARLLQGAPSLLSDGGTNTRFSASLAKAQGKKPGNGTKRIHVKSPFTHLAAI